MPVTRHLRHHLPLAILLAPIIALAGCANTSTHPTPTHTPAQPAATHTPAALPQPTLPKLPHPITTPNNNLQPPKTGPGLYDPTALRSALTTLTHQLKNQRLISLKITRGYLQAISTHGTVITENLNNRPQITEMPALTTEPSFTASQADPNTPATLIAQTHLIPQTVAYIQLGPIPNQRRIGWELRPTHGRHVWDLLLDPTHLVLRELPGS